MRETLKTQIPLELLSLWCSHIPVFSIREPVVLYIRIKSSPLQALPGTNLPIQAVLVRNKSVYLVWGRHRVILRPLLLSPSGGGARITGHAKTISQAYQIIHQPLLSATYISSRRLLRNTESSSFEAVSMSTFDAIKSSPHVPLVMYHVRAYHSRISSISRLISRFICILQVADIQINGSGSCPTPISTRHHIPEKDQRRWKVNGHRGLRASSPSVEHGICMM